MKGLAHGLLASLLLTACAAPPPPRDAAPAPAQRWPDQDGPPARPVDVSQVPDAVPRQEPPSRHGNPPYYEVYGERYYVMDSAVDFVERGIASWYGSKFHGKRTSSGEPYDMYAMTAAHRVLPLPTYLEVTNLRNGRKVIVRVNDRGPFKKSRIIDLSYAAASRLDMLSEGTAPVQIRVIQPGEGGGTSEPGKPGAVEQHKIEYYMQVGAFAAQANAERLRARLEGAGLGIPALVQKADLTQGTLFRVRLGPVVSVADVDRVTEALTQLGIRDFHLAVQDD